MHEYKLFIQRIGLTGATNILIALSSIIFIPILTKNLTLEDYGVWVMIMTTLSLIPNIVLLGLPFTMVRFLSGEKDWNIIREGFYSMTLIIVLVGFIISLMLYFSANYIAPILFDGEIYIVKLLAVAVFFYCLNGFILNYFRTFQQMKRYSFFLLIKTYLVLCFVSFFIVMGYGLVYAILGLLIACAIELLLMLYFIISDIGIKFPRFLNIKEYLYFGVPTIPNNLSYWITDTSDRYLIGLLLGTTFVAYYAPGYTLGYMIIMILAPFSILLPAVLPKYYDNNDFKKVNVYLKYSLKYFLLIAIPSFFFLSILSKAILNILTTHEIALNGYLITPFVALSAILMGIYGIIINIIILEKKTKILGILWIIGAILNITLNLILIPYLGIIGAGIVTLVAYFVVFISTIQYSNKFFKFHFDLLSTLKSILAAIIPSFILIIYEPDGIIQIIFIGVFYIALYLIIIFLLKGISKEEIKFIMQFFKLES